MTNFEKIKSMNIDELADKLKGIFTCEQCLAVEFCDKSKKIIECKSVWSEWLKSEARNND